MNADDPRHGTTTGYRLGCREACCRRAVAAQRADQRKRQYLNRTNSLRTPNKGARRRIQALVALGWSMAELSRRCGYDRSHIGLIVKRPGPLQVETARRIAAIYDDLSMTLPPEKTKMQRIDATRARNMARKHGWPPPLAWDDDTIDDPDALPAGVGFTPAPRSETLAELDHMGAGITTVCRHLDITREALEKWCERHDMSAIYRRLVDRESMRFWANQFTEGGVA